MILLLATSLHESEIVVQTYGLSTVMAMQASNTLPLRVTRCIFIVTAVDLHMLFEHRSSQILCKQVCAVVVGRNPFDCQHLLFFQLSLEALANAVMTRASANAPVVR
jgi:hypothetical protein